MTVEEKKKQLCDWLDSFEWDAEDAEMLEKVKQEITGRYPFQFGRMCSKTECVLCVNGFCGHPEATIKYAPKECRAMDINTNGLINTDVPVRLIAQNLLKANKELRTELGRAKSELKRLDDFLRSESFLSYKGRLKEYEERLTLQSRVINDQNKIIAELRKK